MLSLRRSTLWSFVTHLNIFLLPVLFATTLFACGGSGTSPDEPPEPGRKLQGLEGVRINKIKPSPEGLVLATADGMFVYEDNRFSRAGLEDKDVVDVVFIGQQEMLAGIQASDFVGGEITLFKTTDGGTSWRPFMDNYGGENNQYTWVAALTSHTEKQNVLYARGGVNVSKSFDGGRSWESVFRDWETWGGKATFVKVDPNNPDVVWAGGSNGVFQPYLVKSKDSGVSWTLLEPIQNVETEVYDIIIHPNNSNEVIIGMAPANLIRKSTDGGQTWNTVFEGAGIYTLTRSARDPVKVYASGRNPQGTLFVLVSSDFGDNWERIEMENSPTDIRVNDMVSVMVESREMLYMGTNLGFYSYAFEE